MNHRKRGTQTRLRWLREPQPPEKRPQPPKGTQPLEKGPHPPRKMLQLPFGVFQWVRLANL